MIPQESQLFEKLTINEAKELSMREKNTKRLLKVINGKVEIKKNIKNMSEKVSGRDSCIDITHLKILLKLIYSFKQKKELLN